MKGAIDEAVPEELLGVLKMMEEELEAAQARIVELEDEKRHFLRVEKQWLGTEFQLRVRCQNAEAKLERLGVRAVNE